MARIGSHRGLFQLDRAVFIHIAILSGKLTTGMEVAALAGSDWDAKFKRALDVQEVLDLTNRLGTGLSDAERASLRWHFRATSRYEWMFWDMGYRQEAWPV